LTGLSWLRIPIVWHRRAGRRRLRCDIAARQNAKRKIQEPRGDAVFNLMTKLDWLVLISLAWFVGLMMVAAWVLVR
jgi:hypothetical protein